MYHRQQQQKKEKRKLTSASSSSSSWSQNKKRLQRRGRHQQQQQLRRCTVTYRCISVLLCASISFIVTSSLLLILMISHVQLIQQQKQEQERQKLMEHHVPEIVQVQTLLKTINTIINHVIMSTSVSNQKNNNNDNNKVQHPNIHRIMTNKEDFLHHLYNSVRIDNDDVERRRHTTLQSTPHHQSSSFTQQGQQTLQKPNNDQLIAYYLSSWRYLQRWLQNYYTNDYFSYVKNHTTTTSKQIEMKVSLRTTITMPSISFASGSTRNGNSMFTIENSNNDKENEHELLNMIRIPKAGSSSLSIIGRALAGCQPDGWTCCQRPYDICPFQTTICPSVRGCIDHEPNYTSPTTADSSRGSGGTLLPRITQLRHPAQRLLSGYFHPQSGIHNNNTKACQGNASIMNGRSQNPTTTTTSSNQSLLSHHRRHWECFTKHYINQLQYQNILTKMMIGWYPYVPQSVVKDETHHDYDVIRMAKRRLCTFEWYGILEMPIVSNLLLYEERRRSSTTTNNIFSTLVPHPTVFGLPPITAATTLFTSTMTPTTTTTTTATMNSILKNSISHDEYQNLRLWIKYNTKDDCQIDDGTGTKNGRKDKLIKNSRAGKNRGAYRIYESLYYALKVGKQRLNPHGSFFSSYHILDCCLFPSVACVAHTAILYGTGADEYESFIHGDYMKNNGEALIESYNHEDYRVYQFALQLFCTRVYEAKLHLLAQDFNDATHFQKCHSILFLNINENNNSKKKNHTKKNLDDGIENNKTDNHDDDATRLRRSSEDLCTKF